MSDIIDDLVRGFWNGWDFLAERIGPWALATWAISLPLTLVIGLATR